VVRAATCEGITNGTRKVLLLAGRKRRRRKGERAGKPRKYTGTVRSYPNQQPAQYRITSMYVTANLTQAFGLAFVYYWTTTNPMRILDRRNDCKMNTIEHSEGS